MNQVLQSSLILAAAALCFVSAGKIPHRDCVERSLCYHSTDCCSGCCEENQCIKPDNFSTLSECSDFGVARNCSSLKCGKEQECQHEMRFCLIAPCPQPLPVCVLRKTTPRVEKTEVPLPVKY